MNVRHLFFGKGKCARVLLIGMSLLACESASPAQTSTTWSFAAGLEGGWSAQTGAVSWYSGAGYGGTNGCIRLTDTSTTSNPYATSGLNNADNLHSYAFMGYYKPDAGGSPVPGILGFFTDSSGNTIYNNIGDTNRNVHVSFSAPDANGWVRFVMRVPQASLSSSVTKVRWGVRPLTNDANYYDQGGGYTDELRMEQWLEEPIDLKPVMTTRHYDDSTANNNAGGWTDQGNHGLNNLTTGLTRQPFNIPFDIINPSSNNSKSVVALCGTLTETWYTNQVSVSLSAKTYDRIYLLHTAVGAAAGSTIGHMDVTYSDSTTQTLPIRVGYELADWYGGSIQGKTQKWLQKSNVNPAYSPVYLHATSLELTRPASATISSLTFRGATGSTTPWMLLAATGATGTAGWLDMAEQTANAALDTSQWTPFVPGIHATASNALSLEFLLDAPAGKHGVLQVVDGHLQFADGTPVRFWGTSLHGDQGLFPTHDQADQIAATLARYGINLVRIQPGIMLIDRVNYSDRQHFYDSSDAKWDQFEYLLHALKQKGIYTILISPTGLERAFTSSDGVTNYSNYGSHGTWAYYDSVLRQLGVNYMQTLLSHPNRYESNTPLGQDPSLAAMLWFNERPVFWELAGRLVDSYYSNQLKTQFNAWLLTQYTNRAGLATAWTLSGGGTALGTNEDPTLGTVEMEDYYFPLGSDILARAVNGSGTETQRIRARDNVRFLQYVQSQYHADMAAIAQNLGVSCPISVTNLISDLAEVKSCLATHLTVQNHYWNHISDNGTSYYVQNRPEVSVNPLDITRSPLSEICFTSTKTANCAMGVTETSTMWPNEWRSGHLMSVAAVGSLQNHDILMQYAIHGGYGKDWTYTFASNSILYPTFEHNDPANLSGTMAGAFLFLRGDVQTASNLVQLQVDQTMELAMQCQMWPNGAYPANYLSFVTRFENYFLSANGGTEPPEYDSGTGDGMTSSGTYVLVGRGNATAADAKQRAINLDTALKSAGVVPANYGLQGNKLISATGQIVRDWGNQMMTINTSKSQGFTGFPGTTPINFNNLTVTSRSPYATFQVSSMDNLSLEESKNMLMIAVSRAENKITGRRYQYTNQTTPMGTARGEGLSVDQWSYQGPVMIEPVMMTIQMNGVANTTGGYVRLTPYQADMTPMNHISVFPVNASNQANIILENALISPWFKLERLADQSQTWNLTSNMGGWSPWGGGNSSNVYWDSAKGRSANGSVKIVDDMATSNPYVANWPYLTADANHSYRFSGWYWNTTGTQPGLIAFFMNANNTLLKNIGNTATGVQYEVSAADANGWKKFTMYVPKSLLAGAAIAKAQFCVRAQPNANPYSETGEQMWVDDLTVERLEGHALAWDLTGYMGGWSPWGGGNSTNVSWDSTKGHFANGSIHIVDDSTTSNPYAANWPYLTADPHHGYRFSGWYWNSDGTLPGLRGFFMDASGGLQRNISDGASGTTCEISSPDANGWRRFTFYIPKSLLAGYPIAQSQFCVRPQPNSVPYSDIGKEIWVDDLTLEMMPE